MADHKNGFMTRLVEGRVLFDGGLGSMLIAEGLEPGAPPEEWNRSRPDVVRGVHAAYLEAGADVVTTNTFGATPSRLEGFGLGGETAALNNTGVRLAREAIERFNDGGSERFVALSIGPTGKMLPPVGPASEDEIAHEFESQMKSLEEPVDLVIGETFFDVREALIALAAARRSVNVPVGIGVTYNKTPRGFFTVMGDAAAGATERLEAAGADFLAVNCSLASPEMVELAKELRSSTKSPLLCQPNAGDPALVGGKPVYAQRPDSFAEDVALMIAVGIDAVGGCCGTTPEFIRSARQRIYTTEPDT